MLILENIIKFNSSNSNRGVDDVDIFGHFIWNFLHLPVNSSSSIIVNKSCKTFKHFSTRLHIFHNFGKSLHKDSQKLNSFTNYFSTKFSTICGKVYY